MVIALLLILKEFFLVQHGHYNTIHINVAILLATFNGATYLTSKLAGSSI